jgi:hypothetical protein
VSRGSLRRLAPLLGAPALLAAWPAAAGPPYVTDDPQPTDRGRWEIYNFVAGSHVAGDTAGEAGLDLNYGAAQDLQLTLVIPAAFDRAEGTTHTGMGVVEAAAKLKVLHEDKDGVDLAIFPRLFLATAPARFASRHTNLLLPVWAGKDFGKWSVFGGGGWQLNPGPGQRDFWTGGLAVTRQVTERLNLGAEITHRGRETADGRAFTGLNAGVIYKLTDHWSLLASGGPGVQNARTEGRYDFYVSLKADY